MTDTLSPEDDEEQAELLRHYFEFDMWESLTEAERERRIKWALRTS